MSCGDTDDDVVACGDKIISSSGGTVGTMMSMVVAVAVAGVRGAIVLAVALKTRSPQLVGIFPAGFSALVWVGGTVSGSCGAIVVQLCAQDVRCRGG